MKGNLSFACRPGQSVPQSPCGAVAGGRDPGRRGSAHGPVQLRGVPDRPPHRRLHAARARIRRTRADLTPGPATPLLRSARLHRWPTKRSTTARPGLELSHQSSARMSPRSATCHAGRRSPGTGDQVLRLKFGAVRTVTCTDAARERHRTGRARARSPGAPSRRKRKVKLRLALVH